VLDPHELFVRLLRHVCFDATVLLDWLLTDEALLLLEYLLRCCTWCRALRAVCSLYDKQEMTAAVRCFDHISIENGDVGDVYSPILQVRASGGLGIHPRGLSEAGRQR
jgi:hypothetical protein